jgi:hypothetical protein
MKIKGIIEYFYKALKKTIRITKTNDEFNSLFNLF